MKTPQTPADKDLHTACAVAALAGIHAVASRDERGRRTVILSRGAWTREVPIDRLADALAEAREFA